jgi:hypothetical protein
MAVFTEDGLLYPAEIIKIFENKCVIRYLYYLNEEEKYLDDLIDYDDEEENDDLDMVEEECVKPKDNQKKSLNMNQKNSNLEEKFKNVNLSDSAKQPPPPPPPPFYPPLLPIPPPLLTTNNSNENVNQSLHSMLMSWYMAGYHTGYHYGTVEANKNNAKKS